MTQGKVIVISGVTCSGKTTLTKALKNQFQRSLMIEFDNYDIDQLENAPSIDTPIEIAVNQYDISLLLVDLIVALPLYDYIFIDFPFGYQHQDLEPFIDLAFYVKTPLDICFARSVMRDFKNKNANEIKDWANTYLTFARPLFLNHDVFISQTVDLIIDGTLSTDKQIKLVKQIIDLNL